jgi:hypothetical protein
MSERIAVLRRGGWVIAGCQHVNDFDMMQLGSAGHQRFEQGGWDTATTTDIHTLTRIDKSERNIGRHHMRGCRRGRDHCLLSK